MEFTIQNHLHTIIGKQCIDSLPKTQAGAFGGDGGEGGGFGE